jgi:excisionase family DNA binding protein
MFFVNAESLRAADLPPFMTVEETAALLRTTRKAIYVRVQRHQIAGVVRDGKRRILINREVLLQSLRQQGAPSPQGVAR